MTQHLRPAFVLLALFTILTGIVYPLAITGIAQALVPFQANGSLLRRDGAIVGSALIGQNFTSDRYIQPRPSATSTLDPADSSKTIDAPYNAANSSGSNLGPTSQKLIDRVKADVAARNASGIASPVLPDAVTTSASGLDPHISPRYALAQAASVAKARALPEAAVRGLVEKHIEYPLLGLFGEPRVNVLALNLALDAQGP